MPRYFLDLALDWETSPSGMEALAPLAHVKLAAEERVMHGEAPGPLPRHRVERVPVGAAQLAHLGG